MTSLSLRTGCILMGAEYGSSTTIETSLVLSKIISSSIATREGLKRYICKCMLQPWRMKFLNLMQALSRQPCECWAAYNLVDIVENYDLSSYRLNQRVQYSECILTPWFKAKDFPLKADEDSRTGKSEGRAVSWINTFTVDMGIPSQNTSSPESEEIDPNSAIRSWYG